MKTKPIYKSKEIWVVIIAVINYVFNSFGLPSIEPTPELLAAIIVALGALRMLVTETKLSLK